VLRQQTGSHAGYQVSAPPDALGQFGDRQEFTGLLDDSGPQHGSGARGTGGLTRRERKCPAHSASSSAF
jgi:hypothetical protein